MAIQRINLTRDQLASFLQDFEQIKQFENLFATVNSTANFDIEGTSISAGNAEASANEALALISAIENSIEFVQTAQAVQNNNSTATDYIDFSTTAPAPVEKVGRVYWDGGTTLGVRMTANVIGRVNEDLFYYIKASSAITKGQVVMFTGSVGSSGVPTGAPATGVTDGSYIMGVAAESIALNGFGLVQYNGTLKGIDTSAFVDGDILWYDPAVTGGFTKTKPSAPNVKVQMAAVINAGSGGSGSILIRVNAGSVLGGTDSNVQFNTLADKDLIQYYSAGGYWRNVAYSSITVGYADNLTGGAANRIPYQTATNSTGFIVAPTIASTVLTWNGTGFAWTIPATGTVTSVAALTLGTTGTDLSSTVATGTTTPVITLNVPTASASNRGALSSTDWSTFNGKQAALVSGTNIKTVGGVSLLGSGDVGTIGVTYGGTGTATAFTAGSVVFAGASGVYSQDNTNLFWDNTNKRLGIGTTAASYKLDVRGGISVSSTASGSAPANGGYFGVSSSGLYMSSTGSTPLSFAIGGTERAWLNTTGNYVVGASNDDNINSGVGVKLRGASTGNGVATVSASSTSAAVGLSMYSTGAAAYRFYVSWDGKINCTSTTIAAISDVRMKENIRDLDYGLDTILALKPRRFDWKAGKGKGTKDDIGFIAQEAELVMPEMVGSWLPGPGDPEDLKSLSAGELIPVFVKAIQELTARVEELERNAK